MNSQVEKIILSESSSSLGAAGVVSGQTLLADFVVMRVGVAPVSEFLKQCGFQLEKNAGIKVDEYLKVLGYHNVYATGAVGRFFCLSVTGDHMNCMKYRLPSTARK